MWQSIATALLHATVHTAVKRKMQGGGHQPPQHDDDDDPKEKKRPSVSAWVVLGLVVGTCCMSSGLFSMLVGTLALLDVTPARSDSNPVVGMIVSMVLCLLPSGLMLAACALSLRETARMRRLVTLAESRDALHHDDVAEDLGLDLESARALLDRAVREGYVDRTLVEATEPHGAKSDLIREAARFPRREPAPAPVVPPPVVNAPAPVPAPAEDVKPVVGPTRTCPFCKTIAPITETEKPRCAQCGIPFSSRA